MSKLRKSARGRECQVRVPLVCNHDNSTVVLAHLNGAGMGRKQEDIFAAYCCSACHSWLDGGYVKDSTRDQRDLYHLQGMVRTQKVMLKEGLICTS